VNTFKSFERQLYAVNGHSFDNIALSLFRFQAENNALYRKFIDLLGIEISAVRTLNQIPFLPISFFKGHLIKTGQWAAEKEFHSSGTTASMVSRHFIPDFHFYLKNAKRCFEHFFGDPRDYHFLALLPSYLERRDSSLVAMIDYFITQRVSPHSGFYLDNHERLLADAETLRKQNQKVILWGVSFALLDLAERFQADLSHCLIMETGGMKGRKAEITRSELHQILRKSLNVGKVYSEYGMTEMLSQAYSLGDEAFFCPPGLKILVREITDPLERGIEALGALNVIDLANFHSISFLETEDLGKINNDGSFSVVGRMDNSDVRGCNLLVNQHFGTATGQTWFDI
jgi:phenylacetate-coenzyme A ligase PaaK-like adenylate-forming protein